MRRVGSTLIGAAREVAAHWELSLDRPFIDSCHAYVAPAGDGAVLKLTAPNDDEADHEPDALELEVLRELL